MANGRALVPSPAFTPLSYGLLTVAQDMTSQFNPHWEAGITYMPLCSAPDSTYDECLTVTGVGATPQPETKSASFANVRRASTPFTVYARKDCSTPTFWDDLPEQIREAIFQGESWQVERSFWTGIAAATANVVHPHLASMAELIGDRDILEMVVDELSDSPVDIVLGVGLLDEAIADCYKGQGVLHAPAGLGAHLHAWGLMRQAGGRWVSPNGNLWALGSGYDGSSPDTPGTVTSNVRWIYGTGAAFFARGPVREFSLVEMLDRVDNTIEALTERTYVVGWDCCLVGVPIDITATISGTP